MDKYLILVVDDEREVLDSVLQDLTEFEDAFIIEGASSVAEARDVIADNQSDSVTLSLILCDHIMPEETGIDFLVELNALATTKSAKKLLLTGQADLNDTIEAINHGNLDYYIAKPWDGDALKQIVKDNLTQFIIDNESNLLQWISVLNSEKLLAAMSDKRVTFGD